METTSVESVAEEFSSEQREALSLASSESLVLLLNIIANHFPHKLEAFMTKLATGNGFFFGCLEAAQLFPPFLVEDTSSDISATDLTSSLGRICDVVIDQIWSVNRRQEGEEDDGRHHNATAALIKVLSFALNQLDCDSEDGLAVVKKISEWSRDFAEKCPSTSMEVMAPLLDLLFSSARTLKETSNLSVDVAKQLRSCVGDLNESTEVRRMTLTFPLYHSLVILLCAG